MRWLPAFGEARAQALLLIRTGTNNHLLFPFELVARFCRQACHDQVV